MAAALATPPPCILSQCHGAMGSKTQGRGTTEELFGVIVLESPLQGTLCPVEAEHPGSERYGRTHGKMLEQVLVSCPHGWAPAFPGS